VKLDLHCHTNCSDGSDDWKTILKKAQSLGLEYLSITDHNNCNAYFGMAGLNPRPSELFSGKIITGIEPECHYRGRLIELLGYGIDTSIMRKLLEGVYLPTEKILEEQYKRIFRKCIQMGIHFTTGIFDKWDRAKHYYGGCHLHADMIKYPENQKLVPADSWRNSIQFYRNLKIDETDLFPSAKTIVDIIRRAGGKVFVPHVFLYGDDSMAILNGLVKDFHVDGVECFYNSFTPEQTEFLLDFCRKHKLLVSAGSDYHGAARPHVKLGVDDARLDKLFPW